METACPLCRENIGSAPRVDGDLAQYECEGCGFSFSRTVERTDAAERAAPEREEEGPPPPGMSSRTDGSRLVLERSWNRALGVVFTVVAAVGALATTVLVRSDDTSPTLLAFVSLVLGGITVVAGYGALALLLNRTTIVVDDDAVRASHGPFRFPGHPFVEISTSELVQLFVASHRRTTWQGDRRVRSVRHHLCADRGDGTPVTVTPRGMDVGQALWLERKIEERLGIEDDGR